MKLNKRSILEHLYKKDDNQYINLEKSFKVSNERDRGIIRSILNDLKNDGYIDVKTNESSQLIIPYTSTIPLLEARITTKGTKAYQEEYMHHIERKIKSKWFVFPLLTILLTIGPWCYSYFKTLMNEQEKKIPLAVIEIQNNSKNNLTISNRIGFSIWLPSFDGAPHIDGAAELLFDKGMSSKTITPGEKVRFPVKLLNQGSFYQEYKNGDCTISFSVTALDRGLKISDDMFFDEEDLKKFYTVVSFN